MCSMTMLPQEKEGQQPPTNSSEYEAVLEGGVGAMFLLLSCWYATDFIFGRYAPRDAID